MAAVVTRVTVCVLFCAPAPEGHLKVDLLCSSLPFPLLPVSSLCCLSRANISNLFIYFLMIILFVPTWLKRRPRRGQRAESVCHHVRLFLILFLTQPEDAVQPLPFVPGRDWWPLE